MFIGWEVPLTYVVRLIARWTVSAWEVKELQTAPLVLRNLGTVRGEGKECTACPAREDRAVLINWQKWVAI